MMYPRIKLARNLLSDSGFIFISIDEHEVHNLCSLCFEIFGEENFIALIANTNNPKGRSDDKFIATAHEYILVMTKNITHAKTYGFEPDDKILKDIIRLMKQVKSFVIWIYVKQVMRTEDKIDLICFIISTMMK